MSISKNRKLNKEIMNQKRIRKVITSQQQNRKRACKGKRKSTLPCHQGSPSTNDNQRSLNGHHTVVNLSNAVLSPAEVGLLSKGVSYCPKPPRLNSCQLHQDFQQFVRRIRLKEFFCDEKDEENSNGDRTINSFQRKSGWAPPPNRDMALETYVKAIKRDVDEGLHRSPKRCHWDNLTREERRPLKKC